MLGLCINKIGAHYYSEGRVGALKVAVIENPLKSSSFPNSSSSFVQWTTLRHSTMPARTAAIDDWR